jgi:hypothetical protein
MRSVLFASMAFNVALAIFIAYMVSIPKTVSPSLEDVSSWISQEMKVHRDSMGREISSSIQLHSSIETLKVSAKIDRLAKEVYELSKKKGATSSTVFHTITKDTVFVENVVYEKGESDTCPSYTINHKDDWSEISCTSSCSGGQIMYSISNRYRMWESEERDGIFSRKQRRVNVLNLNPNTSTVEQLSWSIKEKRKRPVLWFLVGLGVGAGASLGVPILINGQ